MRNLTASERTLLRLRLRFHVFPGETLQNRMEGAVRPYAPAGWCAGVARGGDAPTFAFGGEAVQGETPVARDTIFRVASVSKLFTFAAVLQLAREGRLPLDGDAAELLEIRLPKTITPRQLLTHTSGLRDGAYLRAAEAGENPPLDCLLAESFGPHAPGTRFSYSNLGAGVAGMLVEKITGAPFDAFVCKTFFTPYGIDASFHPQHIAAKEKMANCYRVPGNALAYDARAIAAQPLDETCDPLRHYFVPAGKLMISAPDLLSCLQRLFAEYPELCVRQDQVGSVRCDAGRGLGMAYARDVFRPGTILCGHQGKAYGAVCEAWGVPKEGTACVLLTNGARFRGPCALELIGQDAISALLGWAYDKEKA